MTTNVLVAGATGTQGGSVVEHLLSDEYGQYDVYGLTRRPHSEAAQKLESHGVTVVEGDLTDGKRMRECCEEMDAVYCVTTFMEAGTDIETEQGVTMATAADDVGVNRFIYSSVGSADEAPLAHFTSKARVEDRIKQLDLEHTIVRPVFFMQNFPKYHRDELVDGTLSMPMSPDRPLALLDAGDIGKTVCMALADPERFAGETVELAGDNRTPTEIAAALSTVLGQEIAHVRPDIEAYRSMVGDEMADMYEWFEDVGYGSDPTADAEAYGIEPKDFESFLAQSDALESLPPAA
jgi:uncharacterized protein YbjT (DUF2867 family)